MIFVCLAGKVSGEILADFTISTPEGQDQGFTVSLDWQRKPVTTANFMYLAGLEDERWFANPAAATPVTSYFLENQGIARGNINVRAVPGDLDRLDLVYTSGIFSLNVPLERTNAGDFVDDPDSPRWILNRQEIDMVERFVITLDNSYQWFDTRSQTLRDDPFYQRQNFSRLERGRRVFGGSFTNNPFEGPGYVIQDEIIDPNGTVQNPWGFPFNQGFVIAMDSFAPNTSGSRFFITAVREGVNDRWTGNHTAFGTVTINRPLVDRLVNAEEPNTPGTVQVGFRIENINIRYTNNDQAPAQFFPHVVRDASIAEAPIPLESQVSVRIEDNEIRFEAPLESNQQITFGTSDNLQSFSENLIFGPGNPEDSPEMISATFPVSPLINRRTFFRSFVVQHPQWPSRDALPNLAGQILDFVEAPELDRDPDPNDPPPAIPRRFSLFFDASGSAGQVASGGAFIGDFEATYDPSDPFLGTLSLQDMPEALPLETIRLFFENLTLITTRRRFEALEPAELVIPDIPDLPDGIPLPPPVLINPTFSGTWTIR